MTTRAEMEAALEVGKAKLKEIAGAFDAALASAPIDFLRRFGPVQDKAEAAQAAYFADDTDDNLRAVLETMGILLYLQECLIEQARERN